MWLWLQLHKHFRKAARRYIILRGFARFMQHTTRIAALIVAGGTGSRLGGDVPKPYQTLAGKPLLAHTLAALQHPAIAHIQPVIHAEHGDLFARATQGFQTLAPVMGGATRQASVRAGLEALAPHAPDFVLIHDAARPFLSPALLARILEALPHHDAVVPALPMHDTLRTSKGVDVPRDTVLRIQTPQAFAFQEMLNLHRAATHEVTDDAALWLASGRAVEYVMGEETNRKITTAHDMAWAQQQFPKRSKTALGFDVHRFVPSDAGTITLGGISIPSALALEGHSDADVVLHALTDALLGAIGAGDIGQHFPPSDAQWKGANSKQFVAHALQLVQAHGGALQHVDITIIGEKPKISPHREAMRAAIATLLNLPLGDVSVKATTTEGLGFTGRNEGLAAQVMVSVEVPQ